MFDVKVFAANLRAERARKGYSQQTLGNMIGLQKGTAQLYLSMWENGDKTRPGTMPKWSHVEGLAKALNVPLEALVGDSATSHLPAEASVQLETATV